MRKLCTVPARWIGLGACLLVVACTEPSSDSVDRVAQLEELGRREAWSEIREAGGGLLAEIKAEGLSGSIEAAAVIDLLLEAQRRQGQPLETEELQLARDAVRIKADLLGETHLELIPSLMNLGVALRENGDYTAAVEQFERALRLQDSHDQANELTTADTLNQLGWSYFLIGRFDEAREAYQRSLEIRESLLGPDHEKVADSLNNLAILLKNLGDYSEARPLLERAREIYESNLGPDHRRVGGALSNLAMVLRGQGELSEAMQLYEQSLEIMEQSYGKTSRRITPTLKNLTVLYREMGNASAAMELSRRTLTILEQELGPEHPAVASALHNEGVLQYDTQNYEDAERRLVQALELREQLYSPEHTILASTLTSLASVYTELEKYADARTAVDRALKIREASLSPEDPRVAKTLRAKAVLLERQGEYAEAIDVLERVLLIYESTLTHEHPEAAVVMERLGRQYGKLGQSTRGLEYALEADRIGREFLRLNALLLTERDALRYAAVRPSGQDTALSLVADRDVPVDKAWDAVVRSRALVLDELRARHSSPAKTGELKRELARAAERLSNVLVRGAASSDPARYRAVLASARAELTAAEEALARKSAEFRRSRESASVGIDEVLSQLPPSSALVAYVVYRHELMDTPTRSSERRYAAMVASDGQKAPRFVALGAASEIEQRIADWQRVVRRRPATLRAAGRREELEYREVARRLREAVWDPVSERIEGARRVFVVPDGALQVVSLATLPEGEEGEYLIDRGQSLHYLVAERDLLSTGPGDSPGEGLFLLADPAFGRPASAPPDDDCTTRFSEFAPLPGSLREVSEVAALWRGAEGSAGLDSVSIVTGSEASESALSRLAPRRQVVHLATHGFVVEEACSSDAAWDPLRRAATASNPTAGSQPSITGLALAGANTHELRVGGGDGILTAEEVTALDLVGVEWVVLSGCDTGLGEIQSGEGILGLRRAFEIAGASTVITSLWAVDDGSSSAWMRRLYEQRLSGATSMNAVTEASRQSLQVRRDNGLDTHPFHWGTFVSSGDWR